MRILVLGGTVFLGRHFVEAALNQGHDVTLFNRGKSNRDLFPELETLIGDRDGDLDVLQGRQWDAVLDTSGNIPRLVEASAQMLADVAENYTYISSISVYELESGVVIDEVSPVQRLQDESVEEINGETYGGLKALSEKAAESFFQSRTLIVRPGLIVGPYDPSDRFTFWPVRVARGGEILAPGDPSAPVQVIDVRDLAKWLVRAIENRENGVFNATGPQKPLTFGSVLDSCKRSLNSDANFTWLSNKFLLDQGAGPWIEIPLWVPEREYQSIMQVAVDCAIRTGLKFRSLEDTIRDTYQWSSSRPQDYEWRAGMTQDREEALLLKWHNS